MRKFCFRAFCFLSAFFVFYAGTFPMLTRSGTACAALRNSRIEAVYGFRFGNLVYSWSNVTLDVVNVTSGNRTFEGTMVFLDRRGRILARAGLLPRNIAGRGTLRYNAYFTEGSGETARRAVRVIWDLAPR